MFTVVHGYRDGKLYDRSEIAAGGTEFTEPLEVLLRSEIHESLVRDLSIDEAPHGFRQGPEPLPWHGGQVRAFLMKEFGSERFVIWIERICFGHHSTLSSAWTFVEDPDEARRIMRDWFEIGEAGKTYGSEVYFSPFFAGPLEPLEVTL